MANRFSVDAVFRAVDRMSAPVTRMQRRVNSFTRTTNRQFRQLNNSVDKVTTGMKSAGLAVAASAAGMGAAMMDVISVGANFEQAITNAAAKFPGSIQKGSEAFKALEDAARKAGGTTEFTATEAAEALNFLATAGFAADGAIASLPGLVDLATAAQTDLAQATDIATDSLGAFGLATKDPAQLSANLARVSDVFAKATTSANFSAEVFFETVKQGASSANAAGASIETFAALAGTMANSSVKASTAGTALKNMFIRLQAPPRKAAKVLDRLGVATIDESGNMRDMIDIIRDLNAATGDLGGAQRNAAFAAIFGMEAISGVNIVMEAGADAIGEYREQLLAAKGASATMAAFMRDTVAGRMRGLGSAIESVKISLFVLNRGPLADTIARMTEWVRANEKLIATRISEFIVKIIDNFQDIVKWAKRVGKGVLAFVAFVTVLKTLTLVLTAVNLVMAANPIVLITLAVIAAVAAVIWAVKNFDKLRASFEGLPAPIRLVLAPIGLLIDAAGLLIDNWEPISEFFVDMWDKIAGAFSKGAKAVDSIMKPFNEGAEVLQRDIRSVGVAAGFIEPDIQTTSGDQPAIDAMSGAFGGAGPLGSSPADRAAQGALGGEALITIRDETGRAEVSDSDLGPGVKVQNTGGFNQ